MAGSQTDITERKVAEQRLLYDAFHDALTGLPNRTLLMDHLRFAVERAKRREGYLYALLFMDLDRFKDVNDSLGHMMGDQLLIETAKMLAGNLRPTDTVARLGGDEFVVLLEDINNISDATTLADRIQRTLSTSIQLTGHPVYITASIGIVLSVTGYQQPEDVLRDADIAMYRAKALGKDRYEIFDPAMRDRIMERLKLENELRRALDRRELDVFYQPIVSLKTGRIIGLESLVRWHHPERGLVLPREFIPLAEETGLIIPLDRYVLREACRQMHEWHAQMPTEPPLTVSVNMSGKQFTQPDLIESIELILKDTSLEPPSLNVEITESTIMVDHEYTANVLSKLQALGVQVQIDDFGVGYSSLSYLSRFPLNALKVDRTFIKLMTEDSNYLKIVQAIVMMTHGLGMGVIAEGVETEKQLTQLNALGCEYVQGYLLAVPLDSQKVKELLVKTVTGENILARFQINAP
jgi:diguanylate cyclase (GGDEF)-like protein